MLGMITALMGRKAKLMLFIALGGVALGAAGAIGWLTAPVA